MRRLIFSLLPVLTSLLPLFQAGAQTHNRDQNQREEILLYSEEYLRAANGNAALFSGPIQANMPGSIESMYLRQRGTVERDSHGDEIFPQSVTPIESYDLGDILYDGVLYSGVKMRLDLYRDELVVVPSEIMFMGTILNPERVGYADLRGYRIVTSPSADLPGVYYLQLYDGTHQVLKKEKFEFTKNQARFTGRLLRYYIEKDGLFHRVGKRKGLILKVFKDRRDEVRSFMRTHRTDLRRDTEGAIVEIVKEYERLTDR
jgi:hypothetical protein